MAAQLLLSLLLAPGIKIAAELRDPCSKGEGRSQPDRVWCTEEKRNKATTTMKSHKIEEIGAAEEKQKIKRSSQRDPAACKAT